MLKLFAISLLLLSSLNAFDSPKILSIQNWKVESTKTEAMKLGQNVFVVQTIDKKYKNIIAQCFIKNLDSNAKLECKPYTNLNNDNLYQIKPKINKADKLIVAPLQDNVLIIAANFEDYQTIQNNQHNRLVIHSDLFANFLAAKQNLKPTKEDFQEFCEQYFISTVLLAIQNKLYEINCTSFAILNKKTYKSTKAMQQLPFYNRLGTIKKSWYDFSSQEIKNFDSYYGKLIKLM